MVQRTRISFRSLLRGLGVFFICWGSHVYADDASGLVTFGSTPEQAPLEDFATLLYRIEQLELELQELKNAPDKTSQIEQAGYRNLYSHPTQNVSQRGPFSRFHSPFTGKNTHWYHTQVPPVTDQFPTINWSGFLQLDTGWIGQDEANKEAVGNVDTSTGLRRVRLRVDGNVKEDTRYVIDLDFAAAGHPSFRNVMLQFSDIPTFQNLDFGYFKQPFGMDGLTSGRELLMLERQLPFALAPFRQIGIATHGLNDNETVGWNVSTYRFPTDSFGVFQGGSGGHALAGRIYFIPLHESHSGRLVHFGMDYSVIEPGDNAIRYAIQPGFFTRDPGTGDEDDPGTVPVFLDTGDIPTDLVNLFNLELALSHGSFHMETEMRWSLVDQIGGPDLNFPGFYVQAGCILTGETRPYDVNQGVFRRVTPHRPFSLGSGGGAYEIVVVYSILDLNNKNIEGGRGQLFTLGMNWYLHRYTKFQFEFSPCILQSVDEGYSTAFVTALRTQVEF